MTSTSVWLILIFISLPLSSSLSCAPLLIGLPFMCTLLTRTFFLPYAYHVVVFSFFFLFLLLFVFLFFVVDLF